MSLYNMMNGFNLACLYFMPMLDRKQDEWPRFRDCFITEDNTIAIYTRVGGRNRDCGFGEVRLYEDPHFIKTYDDDFDNTYATYEFSVPDKWKEDFQRIINGELEKVSEAYVEQVKHIFPLLTEKGVIDAVFRREETSI